MMSLSDLIDRFLDFLDSKRSVLKPPNLWDKESDRHMAEMTWEENSANDERFW